MVDKPGINRLQPPIDSQHAPKLGQPIRGAVCDVQLHGSSRALVLELVTKDGLYNRAESLLERSAVVALVNRLGDWLRQNHGEGPETPADAKEQPLPGPFTVLLHRPCGPLVDIRVTFKRGELGVEAHATKDGTHAVGFLDSAGGMCEWEKAPKVLAVELATSLVTAHPESVQWITNDVAVATLPRLYGKPKPVHVPNTTPLPQPFNLAGAMTQQLRDPCPVCGRATVPCRCYAPWCPGGCGKRYDGVACKHCGYIKDGETAAP